MTIDKWLRLFDENHSKFKWFFDEYFLPHVWEDLMKAREEDNWVNMMSIMNNVWFYLPDNRFNIMVNPDGWNDFLVLLECPPEV